MASLRLASVRLVPFLLVALLGVLNLPTPFSGDQALFFLFGKGIAAGETPYVDIWDCKQPGIYLLYALGGNLFGFTEAGVHLLDLFYQLAFAAVLTIALHKHFHSPVLGEFFVPLATAGAYFAAARSWHTMQVEALAGLPLFLVLWGALHERPAAWFGSGVAAGWLGLLKLIYMPLPAAIWLVCLAWDRRRGLERMLAAAAGLALVFGITLGWAWYGGFLEALLWTSFAFPLEVAKLPMKSWDSFMDGFSWFLTRFGPWVLLGGCAALRVRRLAHTPGRERIAWLLIVWAAGGFAMILAQRQSWWQYHYMLIVSPLALLALMQIDDIAVRWRRTAGPLRDAVAPALLFAALVCLGPQLFIGSIKAAHMLSAAGSAGTEWLGAYQRLESKEYATIPSQIDFLASPDAAPGPIYVMGNPLIHYFSRRPQAVPLNGGSLESLSSEAWKDLHRGLAEARPAYLYVDNLYGGVLRKRAPFVLTWIGQAYRPVRVDGDGRWYRLLGDGTKAAESATLR